MPYCVFVSYGWHDRWIARQMASLIASAGAKPFIDFYDVNKGDRVFEKVEQGLRAADELVALLTPWSVKRNWVWSEIGSASGQGKRYTGFLFGLTRQDIERKHGGLAFLGPTNVANLDDFDDYLAQLTARLAAKGAP